MFSGWGVRTLSAHHAAFDPLAYQQGSVWAFDNSLIVSGLRRYGEDAAALRVAAATLGASQGFRRGRLPEFIAGTQRLPGDGPTHTPRADPMQAWSIESPFEAVSHSMRYRPVVLCDDQDCTVIDFLRPSFHFSATRNEYCSIDSGAVVATMRTAS